MQLYTNKHDGTKFNKVALNALTGKKPELKQPVLLNKDQPFKRAQLKKIYQALPHHFTQLLILS